MLPHTPAKYLMPRGARLVDFVEMAGQRCGKGLKDVFACIRVIAGTRQHPSSSFQRPVHFLQLSSETGFFSADVLIPAEKCRL